MVSVPEKVWMKTITREWFDYEMTVAFDLAINHYATSSKDRTSLFPNDISFLINEETWKKILEWNQSWKSIENMQEENYIVLLMKLDNCDSLESIASVSTEIQELRSKDINYISKEQYEEIKKRWNELKKQIQEAS